MRNLWQSHINYRRLCTDEVVKMYGSWGDDKGGVFDFDSEVDGGLLLVVASTGKGWDHVSVSRKDRCPTWQEMEQIKRTFFEVDETVMQLHVPEKDHINVHPHCLHLWRPTRQEIPRPPGWMVGPKADTAMRNDEEGEKDA